MTSSACLVMSVSAGGAEPAETTLRFANIFNDHMVLQRDKPVKVWGQARPGAAVTVTLTEDRRLAEPYLPEQRPPDDANTYRVTLEVIEHNRPAFAPQIGTTKADANGDWEVELEAMPAGFTPKYLVLKSGGEGTALRDVLIGEVWVCAGQSNMVWSNFHTKDIESNAPDMPGLRY